VNCARQGHLQEYVFLPPILTCNFGCITLLHDCVTSWLTD